MPITSNTIAPTAAAIQSLRPETIRQPQPRPAPFDVKLRVLAVDDNEEFRNVIKQMLEGLGLEVETCASPVKALELYTREKEKIDLVILDYYMPQLDGAKTFEWLRKLNPDVKVLICSGADEFKLRQLQTQHAIHGYIHKPFRLEEAEFVIRQIFSKSPRRP
jgi:two-component system cell cycle sensor histidine kinase/response regulator CckA